MRSEQQTRTDRLVAWTLRGGAYLSFAVLVAGLLLQFVHPAWGEWVSRAGIVILLATPVLRIIAALVSFLREGDRKYALVSAGVLTIVVLTSVLAITAH